MTWMRLESTVRTHPKIGRLARGLGVPRVQAIGHLVALWTWVLEFAPDGDLESFEPADLADAALWEGDPKTFVDTLISTSLLDVEVVDGTLSVHGWALRAERLKAAGRKAKERASRRVTPVSRPGPSGSRPDVDVDGRTDVDGRRRTDGRSIGSEDRTSPPPPPSDVGGVVVDRDVTPGNVPEASETELELVGEETRGTKSAATRAAIDRVVEHYRSHHPQARPGERERKLIRARLAEGYTVEQIQRAIDGNTASPFNRGENEQGRTYQTLELIVRNSDKVAQFIRLADQHCDEQGRARAAPVMSERTRRNVRAAEAWLQEEESRARP